MTTHEPTTHNPVSDFFSDIRVLQVIGQIVFVIAVVVIASQVMTSIFTVLASRNLVPNFNFLQDRAGFDISERPDWYTSNSSYGEAYQVGIANTLRVVGIGLVLTTLIGVLMGIFLLSGNWLVRHLARAYVEVLRNTPLLVQLFIWYFIVIFALPQIQNSITLPPEGVALISVRLLVFIALLIAVYFWIRRRFTPAMRGRIMAGAVVVAALAVLAFIPDAALHVEIYPAIYISIRGLVFPELLPTARFADWLAFVALGVVLAGITWVYFGRITETTGRPIPRGRYAGLALIGLGVIGWILVGIEPTPSTVPIQQEDGTIVYMPLEEARDSELLSSQDALLYQRTPVVLALPEARRNPAGRLTGYDGGNQISPEYVALLLGLVVYTSAFIADIVRAGIRAVPYGQVEAARSLGMGTGQTLRMIVLPQALRVIIPPLGNQYLNLTKNSSLAISIAYADLFQVTTTIMNQSGQSVTGIFMVMVTYLIMSLSISSVTNWFNRQFQLVTR
jgi:general L-amino acid transport system permease protein